MAKALMFALAAAAMIVAPASAHGPTRQKVTESVEIKAPPEKVWEAISNFQDWSWHPAVGSTEGKGGNDAGATRTLTLKSGGKIDEKLTKYDAASKSYGYEITNVDPAVLPVTNYSSSIKVEGDGTTSKVEWRGAFYRGYMNNDPPPELSDEAAVKAVTGVYRAGLDALKAKLESGS